MLNSPSRTALMSAAARAAHLVVDDAPVIFADTLARRLLGDHADALISYHRAQGAHPVLAGARVSATTRARFAEERLARAVARGTGQYVVLGAGLDTFACRSENRSLRVFEVDAAPTQEWKRRALRDAGVAVPDTAAFVPADLSDGFLTARLADAGFDPDVPAFVSCLGVGMYLTPDTVDGVLAMVAGWAPGSELVMDHLLPEGGRDAAGQAYADAVQAAAAGSGEVWRTFLTPEESARLLTAHGFTVLEQAGTRDSVDRGLWSRTDQLRPFDLPVLVHART